ncbi:hypothetical protein DINM_003323 [Dirofilaria immitis]|nr:hypothetical protein [Dirofilaria immitis]
MLQVEVMPGCGIRNSYIELLLRMPINQAIVAIQNASRYIQNVELTYSSKEPLSRDIMIRLAKDGVRLYFEPSTQLLRLIEVYDLSNIILQYGGVVFSSPKDEADVNKVESCFGATHPGVYVAEQSLYELSWKGLSFSFPTLNETSKVQTTSIDATGLGSLHFRSNSPPLLAKMAIYPDSYNSSRPPKISAASLCGIVCPVEVKSISDGSRISGLFFIFAAESKSVLSSLGAPSKVFYTRADRMLIHRGEDSKNYVDRDILFDCITNRIQKFVLHTNLPGHFDFGIEKIFGAFCSDTTVQPVVLSRSGTENPFGSTFCYGANQIIIEASTIVAETNQY